MFTFHHSLGKLNYFKKIFKIFRYPNPNKIVQQILWMPPDEQLAIFNALHEQLVAGGLLPQE